MKRAHEYSQAQDSYKRQRFSNQQFVAAQQQYPSPYQAAPDMYSQYPGMSAAAVLQQPYAFAAQYPPMAPQYPQPYPQAPYAGSQQPAVSIPSRTVYYGNLPQGTTIEQVLNTVKGGVIDSAKILEEKNCAFITFVDPNSAAQFYSQAVSSNLYLNGAPIKVGWGKPNHLVPSTHLAIARNNATRNVFIGNIDLEKDTAESLQSRLNQFGTIEQVKVLTDKAIAFVHFTTIANAVKCVQTLQVDPEWSEKRVNYGKDRCAYQPKTATAPSPYITPSAPTYRMAYEPMQQGTGMMGVSGEVANRTIYIGGLPPEATSEDICNTIRGGILHSIKYMTDKHIAFVTFVDPMAAGNFLSHCIYTGLNIKGKRVKVAYGKPHPLPAAALQAIAMGATRNVYIGGLNPTEGEEIGGDGTAKQLFTEEKLMEDFSSFGEIEMVNIVREKNCGFVNFTSLMSAVKAVECGQQRNGGIVGYEGKKIGFGKDRCGGPIKQRQPHPLQDGPGNMVMGAIEAVTPTS